MIAIVALAVHLITWREAPGQIGVAIGEGSETRLLSMIPASGCAAGMKIYTGRYGELEAATELLARSKVCAVSDTRRKLAAGNH